MAKPAGGTMAAPSGLTVEQAAREWLSQTKAAAILKPDRHKRYNPSVIRLYESDLDRYVLPDLGAIRLSDLDRGDVQRLVDRLVALGLSGSRVHDIVTPLRALCRRAVRSKELKVNPTSDLELPAPQWWSQLSELSEYQALCRRRVEHVVDVREPLVLISQIYRSGGTLLSQLFDGHPECHAHPHELRIGRPTNRHWPQIDLSAPEAWFDLLYERFSGKYLRRGYSKPPGTVPEGADVEVFPFLFLPRLQKEIFETQVAARSIQHQRDVLDCYFTSYFNAWLDNPNLYSGPKRVVTGMAPEMNFRPDSIEGFFDAYPDGTLVSLVRDPRAWYASARKQRPRDTNLEGAMERWRRSTQATIEARGRYSERVVVASFEELTLKTEATMSRIAEQIGISMSPTLLVPTFNGVPIRANSSYRIERHGVLRERTHAYRETLDPAMIERIDELAGDLYEQARAVGVGSG
jgi:hypothetical protein